MIVPTEVHKAIMTDLIKLINFWKIIMKLISILEKLSTALMINLKHLSRKQKKIAKDYYFTVNDRIYSSWISQKI